MLKLRKVLFSWILLIFFFSTVLAQDAIFEGEFSLEKRKRAYLTSAPNQELLLFITDNLNLNVVEFNEEFEAKPIKSYDRPPGIYTNLLRYQRTQDNYLLCWQTRRNKKLYFQSINRRTGESNGFDFSFNNPRELYVDGFQFEDKFFLLSVDKNSSRLHLYRFDKLTTKSSDIIDLSSYFDPINTNLYEVLFKSNEPKFASVRKNTFPTLSDLSKKVKLYYDESGLRLVLNNNKDYTQIISVDWSSLKTTKTEIPQAPLESGNRKLVKANSFLLDQVLYQLKVSIKELSIQGVDLNTNKELFLIQGNDPNEMPFKSGDMWMKTGGTTIDQSDKKITDGFFGKILHRNPAIHVFPMQAGLGIKIGSFELTENGNSGGLATWYTETVRFYVFLNENMETIQITPADVFIEKALSQKDKIRGEQSAQVWFPWKDSLIYGYYNSSREKYTLLLFQ